MMMDGIIVAFCCERSGYPAADLAGRLRLHYPENLRVIRVPCAGRVDVIHIMKAFEMGASAVVVLGCEEGACHHITGNTRARERVKYCDTLLKEVGINNRAAVMVNISPNAPHKFVTAAVETNKILEDLREAI
jgi:F420-non-reducing hydrogenase iron-sulfur subunit